jgi:OFA family oxalate/formate antiporter-like MFS transporter
LKRYLILVSAVAMQMCLGATYSWSVYVEPIRELTGLLQGPVQAPFTVFYFAFPGTMMLAGTLLPLLGPQRCAVIGGVLFGGGWMLGGLGVYNFGFTVLGIGLLAGIGVGMAYIVPISVAIQWFPENKGLVTGVAVAGFGGGAALVSKLGGWMMTGLGYSPFETFTVFGAAFFLLVVLAGSTMVNPPDAERNRPLPLMPREILPRRAFKVLYFAMFAGLTAGFAVNANLKELFPASAVEAGVTAVALFAVANAAGRVSWGVIFDRVRSATAIRANLLAQALVLLAAPFLLRSAEGLWTVALLTGFNYGGVLVVYVNAAARNWGSAHVGQVYGWLFSANIPAALSPIFAGLAFDHFGDFRVALTVIAVLLIAAALVVWREVPTVNVREAGSEA